MSFELLPLPEQQTWPRRGVIENNVILLCDISILHDFDGLNSNPQWVLSCSPYQNHKLDHKRGLIENNVILLCDISILPDFDALNSNPQWLSLPEPQSWTQRVFGSNVILLSDTYINSLWFWCTKFKSVMSFELLLQTEPQMWSQKGVKWK